MYCFLFIVGLARLAFMHCIGSALCLWASTIVDETMDSLVAKLSKGDSKCHDSADNYTIIEDYKGEKITLNIHF